MAGGIGKHTKKQAHRKPYVHILKDTEHMENIRRMHAKRKMFTKTRAREKEGRQTQKEEKGRGERRRSTTQTSKRFFSPCLHMQAPLRSDENIATQISSVV